MIREDCLLFSGGAAGAEAAFGAAAERHRVDEVNFTFEGHNPARQRGRRILTNAELRRGDVSIGYVSKLMHRKYPDTALFRKVLQTIWHQVHNAQEVFLVGKINEDDTVTGGTGVAAEYAKILNTPLYAFDQPKNGWFRWNAGVWRPEPEAVIRQPLFCGTGTRFLEPNGQAAIDTLFARTFG
ncbi:MAG: hypothetical protein IT373_29380 [Polyangiaceae bacterium]|nr:hypothetical protein [Polyangiaceae bacterium]